LVFHPSTIAMMHGPINIRLVKMSSNCEPQPNQGQRHKQTVLSHSLFCLTTFDQSEKQYKIDTEDVWCCPFSSEACICIITLTAWWTQTFALNEVEHTSCFSIKML